MTNLETSKLQSLVNIPIISRIRRNHGWEHATMHVLAERTPKCKIAGHSTMHGFLLLGNISTDEVISAVDEALERLRKGERNLAIHPNCGTNLVVAGTLAGLAGAMGMMGAGRRWRDKLERLPLVATLATLALMLAQPLGLLLQARVTTSGDPGTLELVDIIPTQRGQVKAHRILTRG